MERGRWKTVIGLGWTYTQRILLVSLLVGRKQQITLNLGTKLQNYLKGEDKRENKCTYTPHNIQNNQKQVHDQLNKSED